MTNPTQITEGGKAPVVAQPVQRNWQYHPAGANEDNALFRYEIKKAVGGLKGTRIFVAVEGLNSYKTTDGVEMETIFEIEYQHKKATSLVGKREGAIKHDIVPGKSLNDSINIRHSGDYIFYLDIKPSISGKPKNFMLGVEKEVNMSFSFEEVSKNKMNGERITR